MFKERTNHVTGQREWVVKEDNYDIAQELARSRFADMILDFDRNEMFLAGLKTIIAEKKSNGEKIHVLDIGTGTGLLSLMAAREGADQVTAVEVFEPMAECARKITQNSEWKDKITVISKRSTDLSHLGDKPNIIVAEVFDTELNGEGALRTFKEALTNLTQPGCRVIPSIGRVWIQLVSSNFLKQFNTISKLKKEESNDCPGSAAVFDLQLSRVETHQFLALTEPFLAFEFDYEDASKIIYNEKFVREVEVVCSGEVDAFLMWWDLDMDRTSKNFIKMAPSWCNNHFSWRDHWMQAIYFPPKSMYLNEKQIVKINCCHDEYSMWFSVGEDLNTTRPYCHCNLHNTFSRQSIFWHNETIKLLKENEDWISTLRKICEGKTVLVLGEGSFAGLLLESISKKVFIVEPNSHFRSYLEKTTKENTKIEVLSNLNEVEKKPDVIFAEPFYLSAMNPWQNLRFWHEAEEVRKRFGHDIPVFPKKGHLKILCEKFTNLHTTSLPVGTVNGFDLSYFDEISYDFKKARQATDAVVDEHPLWEYGGEATSEVVDICAFDLSSAPHDIFAEKCIKLNQANGIPIWVDWDFDGVIRTTGICESNITGKDPKWSVGAKQGVYLIPPELTLRDQVNISVNYNSNSGDMIFRFL